MESYTERYWRERREKEQKAQEGQKGVKPQKGKTPARNTRRKVKKEDGKNGTDTRSEGQATQKDGAGTDGYSG